MIGIHTHAVLILSGILFIILFVMYVYLLLRKFSVNRFQRKKVAWLELHRQEIEYYLLSGQGDEKFAPEAEHHHQAIEDFFSDYLSCYKVDSDNNRVKSFVECFMIPRYRKRLQNSLWSVRINTVHFIDLFHLEKMQDDLLKLLRRKKCSAEERYQIFLLLAEFEYADLQELLKSSRDMPPFLLNEMLNRLVTPTNFSGYVSLFHDLPQDWQLSLLDVFRDQNLRSEQLQCLLESLLEGTNRELRVRALKTIAVLGYITSPAVITQMIENSIGKGDWDHPRSAVERMMTARLMGYIRLDEFLPYLMKLITDRAYNVRTNAALSIRKYKQGREMLLAIAATHEDQFAKSMAREWLDRSIDYE